jgi:electron transport complex protein RnfC
MIKRPFFSLAGPKLRYGALEGGFGAPEELGLPGRVSLLAKDCDMGGITLKQGMSVKTGQKLVLSDDPDGYVISTVTGTISGIRSYTGYSAQGYASISIEVSGEDQWDEGTLSALESPDFELARGYLGSIPGKSDFSSLLKHEPPVNTIVVNGVDQDLLILTNQAMVYSEGISEGIEYLKKVTRSGRVVLAVMPGFSSVGFSGVEVREISSIYPSTLPAMIAKDVLGLGYMPGKTLEEMGIGFVGSEAVLGLAGLFGDGEFPVDKVLTVVGKDGGVRLVKVRVGTPVGEVLSALGIDTTSGDRVIFGGPMTGRAVYSEDMPILWDTDAVMVQEHSDVVLAQDVQCINCGECVRACPVGVPVNMLVRLLGNSLYEEAAEQYDLHCCIECGLCDYVCVARIPIFQYIMLGKQEHFRLSNAEVTNG